jgi:hypothetical protein
MRPSVRLAHLEVKIFLSQGSNKINEEKRFIEQIS